MSLIEKYKFNAITGHLDLIGATASELARLETIENHELLVELTANKGTNLSGQISIPANTTFERNAYADISASTADEDCLVAFVDASGKASDIPATSSTGAYVFVNTLNASLVYQLTAPPIASISLYFVVRVKFKDYHNIVIWADASANNNISSYRALVPDPTAGKPHYKVLAATDKKATNRYLEQEGVFMNLVGDVLPFNGRLLRITAISEFASTWTAEVHINGVLLAGGTLNVVNTRIASQFYAVGVTVNQEISLYVNGIDIQRAKIIALFIEN